MKPSDSSLSAGDPPPAGRASPKALRRGTYASIIEAKKAGRSLTRPQVFEMAKAVKESRWPDYQIAAWLMAVRFGGLSHQETVWLTQAMAEESERLGRLPWEKRGVGSGKLFCADKHSTGGVGDGISLVLTPLAAALGLQVPSMSGRSLGLTGGTLDKLDSIPGFQSRLDPKNVIRQVRKVGCAMFGQNERLAPVDRKFYALRDAVGAVDSRPLIISSILSKKFLEGLDAIVFDVKFGRGAILKNPKESEVLAKDLVRTCRDAGLPARAVLTYMEEPLGRAIGNALEMQQAWRLLEPGFNAAGLEDYRCVTFELLHQMLLLARKTTGRQHSRLLAQQALGSGRALRKFQEMIQAQGVAPSVARDLPRHLPRPSRVMTLGSPRSGWVRFVDADKIAHATLALGVLRARQEDSVDLAAGIVLIRKRGEKVSQGEPVAEVHVGSGARQDSKMAVQMVLEAFEIGSHQPGPVRMVKKVL